MKLQILLTVVFSLSSSLALADDNKLSLGEAGKRTYAMFKCSTLASTSGQLDKSIAITRKAFALGIRYLEAVKKNELSPDDIELSAQIFIYAKAPDPSMEFKLGRIAQIAGSSTFDQLKAPTWNETKILARIQFDNMNCSLFLD